MVYTTRSKKRAPGPNMTRPSGGAKEAAAAPTSSSKASIGFYDDEVQCTDTPGYIRMLAPYIDGFNWAATLLMYSLPVTCKCFVWMAGGWASVLGISPTDAASQFIHPAHPLQPHNNTMNRNLGLAYTSYTGLWPTWRQVAFALAHSYWRYIMSWGTWRLID